MEVKSLNFPIHFHKFYKVSSILFSYFDLLRFLYSLMFYNFGPYHV